jgi:hypothetical protein
MYTLVIACSCLKEYYQMLGNTLVLYYRLTRKVIRDNIYVQYIIYCTVYSMCYDGSEGLYCKMVRAREKARMEVRVGEYLCLPILAGCWEHAVSDM